MNKKIVVVAACALMAGAQHTVLAAEYRPDEVLVKYRDRADAEIVGEIYSKHLPEKVYQAFGLTIEQWQVANDRVSLEETLSELRKDPNVEFAEPNYYRRPLASVTSQLSDNASVFSRLRVFEGWGAANVNNIAAAKQVVVAVVDNAIDIQNPDISGYLWTSPTNSTIHGFDAVDSTNTTNDYDPWTKPNQPCMEGDGNIDSKPDHGTWVSSVIAKMLDYLRTRGVATLPNVKLMPIRAGCRFTVADETRAIKFAVDNGASIINASYGGVDFSRSEQSAFTQLGNKGILVITAAGNSDSDNERIPYYPANLNLPNVMAIAATDTGVDRLTYWTQFGATRVAMAAPGTILLNSGGAELGTSFSAPMVSGVAALLMAAAPTSSSIPLYRLTRAALQGGAVPLADKGFLAVDGRVDALGAMNFLNAPSPMIVIRSVKIDDSARGNANGELDPNETADVALEIENFGADAAGISATLALTESADARRFTISNASASVSSLRSGGVTKLRFSLTADAQTSFRHVFLDLRLTTQSNYTATRRFVVDYSPITAYTAADGKILTAYGNEQDEIQFWHFRVPAGQDYARFNLTCNSAASCSTICAPPKCAKDTPVDALEILIKNGSPPKFEYAINSFPGTPDGGTVVGYGSDTARTALVSAGSGTYYVAVAINPLYVEALKGKGAALLPINYTLTATTGRTEKPKSVNFGCSLGSSAGVDPILPVMLTLALWWTWRRSRPAKDH